MAYEFRNPVGVDKQGFLMMLDPRSKKRDAWKDRFVVIKGPQLLMYKNEECKRKRGEVRLSDADITPDATYPFSFLIRPVIGKPVTFKTGTSKQVEEWLTCLYASRGDTPTNYTVALGDIRGRDVD